MKYSRLKGTYDIIPEESGFYNYIINNCKDIFRLYGYKEIVFPIIEYAELFTRGAGESSDIVVKKEMYVFEDRGKRLIALRPEGTASAIRLYLENNLANKGYSQKLFYIGPMFRAENPQSGRYRQFIQIGAEYLNDPTPLCDLEVIKINTDILSSLSIKDYKLYINSIGCKSCRENFLKTLHSYYSDKIDNMCADCKERYRLNVMRIFDCKIENCININKNAPIMQDNLCENCKEHFYELQNLLNKYNIPYTIDNRLVRGLDYYNKTVFEFKSELIGSQNTFSAGGRYDYLIKDMGGMDTPACGFAIGLERLSMIFEKIHPKREFEFIPDIYIAYIGKSSLDKAMSIMNLLRKNKISPITEYKYDNLKKHLKSAAAMKIKYALFIGEDEIKNNNYIIRNLDSGEQYNLKEEEILNFLKNKLYNNSI